MSTIVSDWWQRGLEGVFNFVKAAQTILARKLYHYGRRYFFVIFLVLLVHQIEVSAKCRGGLSWGVAKLAKQPNPDDTHTHVTRRAKRTLSSEKPVQYSGYMLVVTRFIGRSPFRAMARLLKKWCLGNIDIPSSTRSFYKSARLRGRFPTPSWACYMSKTKWRSIRSFSWCRTMSNLICFFSPQKSREVPSEALSMIICPPDRYSLNPWNLSCLDTRRAK